MRHHLKHHFIRFLITLFLSFFISGCQGSDSNIEKESLAIRDNTPTIYVCEQPQRTILQNEFVEADISNVSKGYISVSYLGENPKVKLQIKNPDGSIYTYSKNEGYENFCLSGGDGTYVLSVYENIEENRYSTCFTDSFTVELESEFFPFLYPSQYVNYNQDTQAIYKAQELACNATSDLEVVSRVYNYVIKTITYDNEKASKISSGDIIGYIPNLDAVYTQQTGICFDFASLMACMLRTQNIPTRLEIGYALTEAGDMYHAWISVYIKDIGWINNLIEFDGTSWQMMDPTMDSTNKAYKPDHISYQVKFIY